MQWHWLLTGSGQPTLRKQATAAVGEMLSQKPTRCQATRRETGRQWKPKLTNHRRNRRPYRRVRLCGCWGHVRVAVMQTHLSMSSIRSPLARLSSSGLLAWKSCTTSSIEPACALPAPFFAIFTRREGLVVINRCSLCIVMTSVRLSKTVAGRVELLVPRSQWLQLHHHHLSFARQDVATSACGSAVGGEERVGVGGVAR